MIKLYDILKEELESQTEPDDDLPLDYYFEDHGFVDNVELFKQLATKQKLAYKEINFPKKKFFVIDRGRKKMVYPVDDDGSVDEGKEVNKYLHNLNVDKASKFFNRDFEQQYNDDFWSSPATLYHGTKNLDEVLKTGLEPRNETRGINNRSVGASVFLTLEPGFAEKYGSVVSIDTKRMKQDGLTPFVSQEPEIFESEIMGAVAHGLGAEDYNYEIYDTGISPDTVIMFGGIPPKYLQEYS